MDFPTVVIVLVVGRWLWLEARTRAMILEVRALIAETRSGVDATGRVVAEARAALAEARLDAVRADILRARAHMRRGLAPIVQRYGIDDPDLIAMSGILYQLTEGEEHGRRN